MKLNKIISALFNIKGIVAAAIVDYESGMIMESGLNDVDLDLEVIMAGGSNILRAQKKMLNMIENKDTIHDIIITLKNQWHIICPCTQRENMFIYIVINRGEGNLSWCRNFLFQIQKIID